MSLDDLRRKYDIPSTPYLPMGKNVLVFRLPMEEKTAGGLFIPGQGQKAKQIGILVAAGLGARDVMRSHLVDIGDLVHFGRFAGDEEEYARDPEGKGKHIIQMKIEDILGSVEALERSKDYKLEDDDEGNLIYVRK